MSPEPPFLLGDIHYPHNHPEGPSILTAATKLTTHQPPLLYISLIASDMCYRCQ